MEKRSLGELFSSEAKTDLFSGTPFQAAKPKAPAPVEEPAPRVKKDHKNSKSPGISEEDRMVFVGNVSLDCKKKTIKKLMSTYGEVEAVWRRSIPLDRGKLPITAAVALKMVRTT